MSIGFSLKTRCRNIASFRQTLDDVASLHGYTTEHDETSSTVGFCRLGFLQFTYERDKRIALRRNYLVCGECQTNLVGAGFHKAAIEFVDELALTTGRPIEVDDETGYYERRDFERMRSEHFYGWLRTLTDIIREEKEKGSKLSYICWPIDGYKPDEVEGSIVSPFGRFCVGNLLKRVEEGGIEAFAREFFIWNEAEQDARFHRNLALNALWEDCRFMPSARDYSDNDINAYILEHLEKAACLDPALPFPKECYLEICCLHEHKPIALDSLPDYESDYPIGYRRGWISHKIGNITFYTPGNHLEEEEGNGTLLFYDDAGEDWHTTRCTAFRVTDDELAYTEVDDPLLEERIFDYGECRLYDAGEQTDGDEEKPFYMCTCHILSAEQYTLLTFCASTQASVQAYAREAVGRLRADKPQL